MAMGSAQRNLVVAFLMIAGLLQSANAATETVGGTTGWTLGISATFYDDWANSQTFAVGDKLDFVYSGTTHNVYEVTAAALASCDLASPLKTYDTSGGALVPITTAGAHYYICGIPGHCLSNMQMTIVVPAAASPTSAPAPSTKAPVPSKAPGSAPVAPLLPSTEAPAPGPAHGTSKGQRSAAPAMVVGVVLCFVTAFLFH